MTNSRLLSFTLVQVLGTTAMNLNQAASPYDYKHCAEKELDLSDGSVCRQSLRVQRDLTTRATEQKWTLLQKMVPVIVGLSIILIATILFLLYRRRKFGTPFFPSFRIRPLHRRHNIHEQNRSNTWTIEDPFNGDYAAVERPPLLPPLSPDSAKDDSHEQELQISEQEHAAAHHLRQQRPQTQTERHWRLSDRVRSIPDFIPWKRHPIRVQPVAPSRRFRIADYDASTTDASSSTHRVSDFSRSSTTVSASAHVSANTHDVGDSNSATGRHSTIYEVDEGDEGASFIGGGFPPPSPPPHGRDELEEHTSLISSEERGDNKVYLISRVPGRDFTLDSGSSNMNRSTFNSSSVNSNVKVVSPSPTVYTPIEVPVPVIRSPPARTPPPRMPPAPTQQPPQPPPARRRPSDESSSSFYSPPPRSHPLPLPPVHRRPSEDSITSQGSNSYNPPHHHQRQQSHPLPPQPYRRPSDESVYSQSQMVTSHPLTQPPQPRRKLSDESVYTQSSSSQALRNGGQPYQSVLPPIYSSSDLNRAPSFERRPSEGSVVGAGALSPMSGHGTFSSFEHFPLLSPPLGARRPDTPGEAHSQGTRRGDAYLPRTPNAAQSRFVEEDMSAPRPVRMFDPAQLDSGGRFGGGGHQQQQYLGVMMGHERNVSSESVRPALSDHVMLFPGSVRGAGYRGTPSPSPGYGN